MTSKKLRDLQQKKSALVDQLNALNASIGDSEPNADQSAQWDALKNQIAGINAAIGREETLLSEQLAAPSASFSDDASVTGGAPRLESDPKRGFTSMGEFAAMVKNASVGRGRVDERLLIGAAAPSTYGNEAAGVDGGYLVPPEFSREIFRLSLAQDALLPLTQQVTTTSNSMVFPKDETTPWGTDGVRAYWQAEGASANATKPKLGTSIMRLHKLMALVPVSDELLSDTDALTSYLPDLMGRSIRWKTDEAILYGTGAGQPQGINNSGAVVEVAKESGQAANTLLALNITNMVARLLPGSLENAVWLITPDALPALFTMTIGTNGVSPLYLPFSAGIQGSPYGSLAGRPVLVTQHAAAFSAAGDVQLIDFNYYRTLTKGEGIRMDSSMHLYFDADATAFRAMFRIDGASKMAAPVAQAKGSNSLSPFVRLGAR